MPSERETTLAVIERLMQIGWIPRTARIGDDVAFEFTPRGLEATKQLHAILKELGPGMGEAEWRNLCKLVVLMRRES